MFSIPCRLFLLLGLLAGSKATFDCFDTQTLTGYTRYNCTWTVDGQPECEDLSSISGMSSNLTGPRINSPDTSITDGDLYVELILPPGYIEGSEYPEVGGWTASFDVDVVICKASTGYLIYEFDQTQPAGPNEVSIVCPEGKGISHLDFCGIMEEEGGGGSGSGGATCDSPCSSPNGTYACASLSSGSCGSECPAGAVCEEQSTPGSFCIWPIEAYLTTECRARGGACDVAEVCTGSDVACPEDVFEAQGTECRASGGACDVAEVCTGTATTCPDDVLVAAGTVCRDAEAFPGSCDVEETCDGVSAECPVDGGATEIGMTFKCANTIYFSGGVDMADLFAGNKFQYYFAGDDSCNVGANKQTEWGLASSLTEEGCAPATCDNGRGLSNMVWGECVLNDDEDWVWACGGKLETGDVAEPLCPSDAEPEPPMSMRGPADVSGTSSATSSESAGPIMDASMAISIGAAGLAAGALVGVGVVLMRLRKLETAMPPPTKDVEAGGFGSTHSNLVFSAQ